MGLMTSAQNTVLYGSMLQFDLGLAAGGLPVDVTKIQMVFSTYNATTYTV